MYAFAMTPSTSLRAYVLYGWSQISKMTGSIVTFINFAKHAEFLMKFAMGIHNYLAIKLTSKYQIVRFTHLRSVFDF